MSRGPKVVHELGRLVEFRLPDLAEPLWRYDYGTRPKPFFHPLCTPAGRCLTNYEPHDHVWHRGLWFTIKFVNGANFWEENEPFGVQTLAAGPSLEHGPAGGVSIETALRWTAGDTPLLHEERIVRYLPLDDESFRIEFDSRLEALGDTTLDRTPFTTWGGYGGLILRGSRNWYDTEILLADGTSTTRPTGQRAAWASLQGKIDGGRASQAGAAMFDHPSNPRAPTPWYGATGTGHYLNAAFLFHEPMSLAEGECLAFRYALLVHDHRWAPERVAAAYEDWLAADGALA